VGTIIHIPSGHVRIGSDKVEIVSISAFGNLEVGIRTQSQIFRVKCSMLHISVFPSRPQIATLLIFLKTAKEIQSLDFFLN
jgi:hypothetical protein